MENDTDKKKKKKKIHIKKKKKKKKKNSLVKRKQVIQESRLHYTKKRCLSPERYIIIK